MLPFRTGVAMLPALCALAASCGGTQTDVTAGVDELNKQVLGPQGAQLNCPDRVDGAEGATFECTMKAAKGGASAPVTLKIVEENEALAVDVADQAQYDKALEKVTAR